MTKKVYKMVRTCDHSCVCIADDMANEVIRETREEILAAVDDDFWRLFNLNSLDQSERAIDRRLVINEVRHSIEALIRKIEL